MRIKFKKAWVCNAAGLGLKFKPGDETETLGSGDLYTVLNGGFAVEVNVKIEKAMTSTKSTQKAVK